MNSRTFISFEHHKKDRAIWLYKQITAAGFPSSNEDDFGAGSPRQEMSSALRDCNVFVALVTPEYTRAQAPKRELDYAEAFDKKIIAIFLGLPSRDSSAEPYTAYRRIE